MTRRIPYTPPEQQNQRESNQTLGHGCDKQISQIPFDPFSVEIASVRFPLDS
jgi:hypothetical protein